MIWMGGADSGKLNIGGAGYFFCESVIEWLEIGTWRANAED